MLNGWRAGAARTRGTSKSQVVLAALVGLGALAAPAAAADRGYEKVTPSGKGAGTVQSVDTFRSSADGDRFLLSTSGPFASVQTDSLPLYARYLAARGPDGWNLTGTDPASGPMFNGIVMTTLVSSDDLSHVLVASTHALVPGAIEGGGNLYVRNTITRAYTLVVAHPDRLLADQFLANQGNYGAKYVANDGRSAIFATRVPLVPGAVSGASSGYRWTADAGLELVTRLPDGTPVAGGPVDDADEQGVREARPGQDGVRRVYFSREDGSTAQRAVYLRRSNDTVLVSQSRIGGTPSGVPVRAVVRATSKDTRYAVIEVIAGGATARLSDDAPATLPAGSSTRVFYRYDAELDVLNYIGRGVSTLSAPVFGFSDDGQTVAFRSTVAQHPDAVDGRVNVYLWRDGVTKLAYVADPGSSQALSVQRDLKSLSPNGRYVVFTDNSPSVAAQFGLDNYGLECGPTRAPGHCAQVYRFDAEAADLASGLVCVSCRTDGEFPRGDAGDPTNSAPGFIRMDRHQVRMAFDDGRVLFTSPDDLVAADGNGLPDVYEYRNGTRTLLSRGTAGRPARLLDASVDGSSVFFSTDDQISPLDDDQALDVYVLRPDARTVTASDDGAAAPCTGSDCHGLAPQLAPPAPAATALLGPAPAQSESTDRPERPRLRSASISRNGRVTVKVQAPTSGRIRVSGRGVRAVTREVTGGTTYTLRTRLSKQQRAKAKSSKRGVRIRLRVSVSPNFGSTRVIHVARRARS